MVMAVITEILSVVRVDGDQPYYITTALVDGDECSGWGKYEVGEEVEKFFDEKHNHGTMYKKGWRKSFDSDK